jgi:GNAT superfamily N-acetyltransferase
MAQIETLVTAQWPSLAEFIHRCNRRADGKPRCLHAAQGDTVEAHAAELSALPADQACFLAVRDTAGWSGMAGVEIDEPAGRAWLRGPLTRDDDPALRQALLEALLDRLPLLTRFDAFPHVDEAALRDTLRTAGFRDRAVFQVMTLVGEPANCPPAHGVHPAGALADDEATGLVALHDRLFPATYLPGAAMLAGRDQAHQLLIVREPGGAIAGYVHVQETPLDADGYIDYLGVDERWRGRGYAARLLAAAVHWAIVQRGRSRISLTVRDGNADALHLYERAGFVETSAGVHLVLERG